jgi:cation transport ATPase
MKFHFSLKTIIPLFVLTGLIFAGLLYVTESTYAHLANPILFVTLIVGAAPLFYDISRSILHKQFGVDLIALAAIAGSLIFGQYVAGTVILLMLSGGEALEGFALRRARKELTSLINNAPTTAHRKEGDRVVDISAADVQVGDTILVKPGEVIPVDGRVTSGTSMVDESALTGEPIPVQKSVFSEVMSGSVSEDGVLEIEALRPSTDSKYERIIRLVKEAEENKVRWRVACSQGEQIQVERHKACCNPHHCSAGQDDRQGPQRHRSVAYAPSAQSGERRKALY